jgi:hypothetical protein
VETRPASLERRLGLPLAVLLLAALAIAWGWSGLFRPDISPHRFRPKAVAARRIERLQFVENVTDRWVVYKEPRMNRKDAVCFRPL